MNYGPPKDMDSFVQEFGRAGRDDKTSMASLLFHGKQCKNRDGDMKTYVTNTGQFRRDCLLSAYGNHKYKKNSMGFPFWKLPFSMWLPSRVNSLRSGLQASIAWKLGSTSGFPIWKIGGNYIETPGFQSERYGKPQGNLGFPI